MHFQPPTTSNSLPTFEPRRVLIDALNVAYWCGQPPSLRLPLGLMSHLLAAGHVVQLYFDASAPHRLGGEAALYAQLIAHGAHFIEAASGRSADQLLLKHARAGGACIVSRDQYGDHRRRYRKLIDDPTRLLPGWVRDERLQVPALAVDVPLAPSAEQAWLLLQPELADHAIRQESHPHQAP